MKQILTFNETHCDEITCLKLNQKDPSVLIASSLDGMLCKYDLKQQSEEDAVEFAMKFD